MPLPLLNFHILISFLIEQVSYTASSKLFTPYVVDTFGIDPNFKALYDKRVGFLYKVNNFLQKRELMKAFKAIER